LVLLLKYPNNRIFVLRRSIDLHNDVFSSPELLIVHTLVRYVVQFLVV